MLSQNLFHRFFIALSILMLLSLSDATLAQKDKKKKTKEPAENVLRIETESVELDVTVTDKKGRPVPNLTREDFVIKDDGQPQNLTSFGYRTLSSFSPSSSSSTKPNTTPNSSPLSTGNPPTRYIILALDDLHIRLENVMRTRDSLLKFVNEQMLDDDYVAIFSTSGQLPLYQQFTNDRETLRRAVRRIELINRPEFSQVILAVQRQDLKRHNITPYIAELINNEQFGVLETFGGNDYDTPEIRVAAISIAAQTRIMTDATLETIKGTLRTLRPLAGKKMMVLVSEGFLLGGGVTGAMRADLSYLIDAATRSGVTIYSFDVRGLKAYVPGGSASTSEAQAIPVRLDMMSDQAEQTGARTLAEETGGLAITDNNDLNFGIQKFLEDTESYYQVSFEPLTAMKDGRYHKLLITLPNYPDYKIRTRKGYVAFKDPKTILAVNDSVQAPKTEEQLAEERTKANAKLLNDGLASLYALRGIPLELDVHYLEIQNKEALVSINIVIDATKLKYDQVGDRYRTQLELACNIYDEKGKLAKNFSEYLTLNPKAETLLQATKTGGFRYHHEIKLKPGTYQIRMAVREEKETRVGSATDWIEIPDLSKLQLAASQIHFLTPEEIKNLRSSTKLNSEGQLDPITLSQKSQIARRFTRDIPAQAVLAIYNAKSNEQGDSEIKVEGKIFSRGKEIMSIEKSSLNQLPNTLSTAEAMLYQINLPLKTLPLGQYELRLEIFDALAKKKISPSISFKIE